MATLPAAGPPSRSTRANPRARSCDLLRGITWDDPDHEAPTERGPDCLLSDVPRPRPGVARAGCGQPVRDRSCDRRSSTVVRRGRRPVLCAPAAPATRRRATSTAHTGALTRDEPGALRRSQLLDRSRVRRLEHAGVIEAPSLRCTPIGRPSYLAAPSIGAAGSARPATRRGRTADDR